MHAKRAMFFMGLLVGLGTALSSCGRQAGAGPYGGDLVALENGNVQAEVLTNADSGEVMVHTWTDDLKTPRPIDAHPIVLGSEDRTVTLAPHPLGTDPPGRCSRFYGKADWVRGGGTRHGWLHMGAGERIAFDWSNCWQAGRANGPMWSEMGLHHGQGMGHDAHGETREHR